MPDKKTRNMARRPLGAGVLSTVGSGSTAGADTRTRPGKNARRGLTALLNCVRFQTNDKERRNFGNQGEQAEAEGDAEERYPGRGARDRLDGGLAGGDDPQDRRARRVQPTRYLRVLRLEGGPASRARQDGLRRSARCHREGPERLRRPRRGPARDVERLVPLRLRSPRPLPGHVRPRGGLVPRSRAGEGGGRR